MAMNQDFKPIFDYLDVMKTELKDEIVLELTPKFDRLQSSVDNLTHMVKGFQEEMIVNRNRLDRLETWVKEASAKLGISHPF